MTIDAPALLDRIARNSVALVAIGTLPLIEKTSALMEQRLEVMAALQKSVAKDLALYKLQPYANE